MSLMTSEITLYHLYLEMLYMYNYGSRFNDATHVDLISCVTELIKVRQLGITEQLRLYPITGLYIYQCRRHDIYCPHHREVIMIMPLATVQYQIWYYTYTLTVLGSTSQVRYTNIIIKLLFHGYRVQHLSLSVTNTGCHNSRAISSLCLTAVARTLLMSVRFRIFVLHVVVVQ